MQDEIVGLARAQLVQEGSEAISLRAISRGMGLAPSAIHRFFPTREAVLDALRGRDVDALAAAMTAADRGVKDHADYGGRIGAALVALRDWALANPNPWLLLAGGAGSAAGGLAGRFLRLAIGPLSEARAAHAAVVPPRASLSVAPAVIPAIDGLTDVVPRWQLATLAAAFAWACGAVTVELQAQLAGFVQDPEALFAAGVEHWIAMLGL